MCRILICFGLLLGCGSESAERRTVGEHTSAVSQKTHGSAERQNAQKEPVLKASTPKMVREIDDIGCDDFHPIRATSAPQIDIGCTNMNAPRVKSSKRDKNVRELLTKARHALKSSDYVKADDFFSAAHKIAPQDGGIQAEWGFMLFERAKNINACEEDIATCTELSDEYQTAAEELLSQAVKLEGTAKELAMRHHNLGKIQSWMTDYQAAASAFHHAQCLDPTPRRQQEYARALWELGSHVSRRADQKDHRAFGLANLRASVKLSGSVEHKYVLVKLEEEAKRTPAFMQSRFSAIGPFESMEALEDAYWLGKKKPQRHHDGLLGEEIEWERVGAFSIGLFYMRVNGMPRFKEEQSWFMGAPRHDLALLVARKNNKFWSLYEVGQRCEDSREFAAYAMLKSIQSIPKQNAALVHLTSGRAMADECHFATYASDKVVLCGLDGEKPSCWTQSDLGPTPYQGDLLQTRAAVSGECEGFEHVEKTDYRATFDVNVDKTFTTLTNRIDGTQQCIDLNKLIKRAKEDSL